MGEGEGEGEVEVEVEVEGGVCELREGWEGACVCGGEGGGGSV